jgi:hypothetical protein
LNLVVFYSISGKRVRRKKKEKKKKQKQMKVRALPLMRGSGEGLHVRLTVEFLRVSLKNKTDHRVHSIFSM